MTETNPHQPTPAVKSDGATPATSVDAAAQTRGAEHNSLAGARMPAPPTDPVTDAPEPARRANVRDIVPDYESADEEDAAAAAENEPGAAPFTRRPFGSQLPKLYAPQRKGYRRYWFNDKPGRIARAKEAGYSIVNEDGKPMCRVVQGGGLRAYFMEIPIKYFEEDMRAGQRQVDEIDRAIRGGDIKRTEGDNRYVPKDAIKFKDD